MPCSPLWWLQTNINGRRRICLVVRNPGWQSWERMVFASTMSLLEPVEALEFRPIRGGDRQFEKMTSLTQNDRPVRDEASISRHPENPFQGEILGSRSKRRPFTESDCVYIVLQSKTKLLCASERAWPHHPHHTVIRAGGEAGKRFDPLSKWCKPCCLDEFIVVRRLVVGVARASEDTISDQTDGAQHLEMNNVEVGAGDR